MKQIVNNTRKTLKVVAVSGSRDPYSGSAILKPGGSVEIVDAFDKYTIEDPEEK